MSIKAKKHLGQNFLIDPNIRKKIIESCELKKTDIVLEIGPGKGALTQEIAPKVKKIIAVETDPELVTLLKKGFDQANVEIIHEDFLKFSFESLPKNIKIIGNLPYNISTPIITKVLENKEKFTSFFMTVQREYGQRLAAKVNTKNYGSMSLFVQYHCEIDYLFKIKNTSFKPVPKVESCFLKLNILQTPKIRPINTKTLFKLIHAGFNQRRKCIQNSLATVIKKEGLLAILDQNNISPQKRAENLSLADFTKIADSYLPNR